MAALPAETDRGGARVSGPESAGCMSDHPASVEVSLETKVAPTPPRRSRIGAGLLVVLAVGLTGGMGLALAVPALTPGVDESYLYAVSHAAAARLRFGREFISTYGPLGYVVSPAAVDDVPAWWAVAELLRVAGSGIAVAVYVRAVPGLGPAACVVGAALLAYALALQVGDYRWFAPWLLAFLASLQQRGRGAWLLHAAVSGLAGLYFLLRFSLGFGALVTLVVGSVLTGRPGLAGRRLGLTLGSAAAGLLAGWIATGGWVADLPGYLATGWELGRGYSSAMSLVPADWWRSAASFGLYLVVVAVAVGVADGRARLALAGLAFPIFVGWKHGMVRQDAHVFVLPWLGVFVCAALGAEAWASRRRVAATLLLALALVPLAFTAVSQATGGF